MYEQLNMTREELFLQKILSDHLSGEKTIPQPDIDWQILYDLAYAHQVVPIAFYQCKDYLPAQIRPVYETRFLAALYYYASRKKAIQNIREAFSERGVPYFIVKGVTAAAYYPLPGLRTMGDTDIIVHETDREQAVDILLSLGFSYKNEYTGKEQIYLSNGMEFELHHGLVYDEDITLAEHKVFFNNCWDYVQNNELDHSFHFLYLILHLRKHLMNQGVGFRQFMDIAVVAKNDPSLNWPWIEEQLDALGLRKFAGVCFALTERWFGIDPPIERPELDDAFVLQATEKIFKDGVFGFANKSNEPNYVSNKMRNAKGPRWLKRLSMIMSHAFPGYHHFKGTEKYAFIDGKPWLLPVAWCYRFYLMFRGETTTGTEVLDLIMTPGEELDAREEDLRQWGLL